MLSYTRSYIALVAQVSPCVSFHVIHACALVFGCLSVLSSPVSLLLPQVLLPWCLTRIPWKIPCATSASGAWSAWTMSHPTHEEEVRILSRGSCPGSGGSCEGGARSRLAKAKAKHVQRFTSVEGGSSSHHASQIFPRVGGIASLRATGEFRFAFRVAVWRTRWPSQRMQADQEFNESHPRFGPTEREPCGPQRVRVSHHTQDPVARVVFVVFPLFPCLLCLVRFVTLFQETWDVGGFLSITDGVSSNPLRCFISESGRPPCTVFKPLLGLCSLHPTRVTFMC